MYCPRCASKFEANTSFCRTCGLALDGVDKIVEGDAANAPEVRTRPRGNTIRLGIGLFMLGTAFGLANILIREVLPEIYGKTAFLFFVITGMLTIAIGFLFPKKQYMKRSRPEARTNDLASSPAVALLPNAGRNVDDLVMPRSSDDLMTEPASVTDRTTRRLG